MKPPTPIWARIVIFAVWPVLATMFLIMIAALFIVIWPVIPFSNNVIKLKE